MMDRQTLAAYDSEAAAFAKDWHEQPAPADLQDVVTRCGVLYLSWRVTEDADVRDAHGRLYTAFDAPRVLSELTAATVLTDEEVLSVSSGKKIHRILVKKTG